MSGRGRGKVIAKRHQKQKGRLGISNPGFKRVAREVGIKRISLNVYPQLDEFLKKFLKQLAKNSVELTRYSKRKTITARDLNESLKKMGRSIY